MAVACVSFFSFFSNAHAGRAHEQMAVARVHILFHGPDVGGVLLPSGKTVDQGSRARYPLFFLSFFFLFFSRAGLGPGTLYFFSFVRELATPGVLHSENEIEKYLMKGLGPGTFFFVFFSKCS